MALSPYESARLVSQLSKDVKISKSAVETAAKKIILGYAEENYSIGKYKEHELHPKTMDSFAAEWIFFVDTMNFSFWSEEENKCKVKFNDKLHTGYWSLCASVNRAIQEGYPILSAEFCANVSLETLKHIFRSDTEVQMPLLEERQRILNETGKCLIEKFGGSFTNVLPLCNNSAKKLLELIVQNFPSYRDEATINGHRVSFYKRAQILIGDIWACFEGKGYGNFHDISSITIFADYRIPQVLVYFGVLEYSEELMKTLKEGTHLKNGERYEVEIRGCTIWAVELICQAIKEEYLKENNPTEVNAILIDNYLWDYRRSHAEEMEKIPFHKTRCIYY